MPIAPNTPTTVNGLTVNVLGNPGVAADRSVYMPTARQLLLIEEAINECKFDWWRFGAFQAPRPTVSIELTSEAWLYGGFLGITDATNTPQVVRPDGALNSRAWAPAIRPNGVYGDYGACHVPNPAAIFSGVDTIYILTDLDERSGAFGGARFFKETLIRYLGTLVAMKWALFDPYKMFRAACCFSPVDRRDFEGDNYITRAQQWYYQSIGHWAPGPMYSIYARPNDPLSGTIGQAEGDFVDATPSVEQTAGTLKSWGSATDDGQTRWPWETRLIEAASEAFKDVFLPRSSRRFNNRTAVKLKASAEAFDRFVSLFQDEVPIQDSHGGWSGSNGVSYHDVLEVIPESGAVRVIGQSWDYEESQRRIFPPNDPPGMGGYFPALDVEMNTVDKKALFIPSNTPAGGIPRRNFSSTWTLELQGTGAAVSRSAPDRGMLFQRGLAREKGYRGYAGAISPDLYERNYHPGTSTLTDPKFFDPREPNDVQEPLGGIGWRDFEKFTLYQSEFDVPKGAAGIAGEFIVRLTFGGSCTIYTPACSLAEGLDNNPTVTIGFLPVTIGYWNTYHSYMLRSPTKGHPVNPYLPVATARATRPGSRILKRPVTGKAGKSQRIDTDFLPTS